MPEPTLILKIVEVLAYLFIFALGSLLLVLLVVYIDSMGATQNKPALKHEICVSQ